MPRVQLPAITLKHKAWNKGRAIGRKRPLLQKPVWGIRARLGLADYLRDLTLFNVAIDSKLRGCDLVKRAVPKQSCGDLSQDGQPSHRAAFARPHEGRYHRALLGG